MKPTYSKNIICLVSPVVRARFTPSTKLFRSEDYNNHPDALNAAMAEAAMNRNDTGFVIKPGRAPDLAGLFWPPPKIKP